MTDDLTIGVRLVVLALGMLSGAVDQLKSDLQQMALEQRREAMRDLACALDSVEQAIAALRDFIGRISPDA